MLLKAELGWCVNVLQGAVFSKVQTCGVAVSFAGAPLQPPERAGEAINHELS